MTDDNAPAPAASGGGDAGENARDRVRAVRELVKIFGPERIVYLAMTGVSVVALVACALVVLFTQNLAQQWPGFIGLFGSSGIVTYSVGRILSMWNQAFRYIAGGGAS